MASRRDVTRREFLAVVAVGVLAATAGAGLEGAGPPEKPGRPPHVVFVVADDMGWRDTAYQGHPVVKTPHLDDMAGKGVRFDYFYPGGNVCSPGRYSIMTGRTPFRGGLHYLGGIPPHEVTVAKALKTAGYRTAHFGKWHLGLCPVKMGFDQAIWSSNCYDAPGFPLYVNDTKEIHTLKEGDTSVTMMDLALDYIRRQAKEPEPFFVQVCFSAPHSPNNATPEFTALYKDGNNKLAEISGLDAAVGNLRAELRRLGIAENTLVWFVSDNGGGSGDSNDPSGKGKMDAGARTVACLEWPARVKRPIRTSVVCAQMDMYPTVLEAAGVKLPDPPVIDGISLLPLFDGKMAERTMPLGFMLWPKAGGGGFAAIDFVKDTQGILIDGKYKLMVHPPGFKNRRGAQPPPVCLYDIYDDPAEKTNLAEKTPEVVARMRATLEAWQRSVRASYDEKDRPRAAEPQPNRAAKTR
jgi:arylsulfatase A-like enzyme